jgi:transcription elongation factor Elf1
MNHENSQRQVADGLALAQAASKGKLDELDCPQCEHQTVSVFFTRPTPKEYHTWFVCSNCDYSVRFQNSGRPEFYSPDRDRTGKKAVAASSDEKQ